MSQLIVHGLWIGDRLGPMQQLTIKSFLAHGFTFYLWAYNENVSPLPTGTNLKDANEIITEDRIFKYPAHGPLDVSFGTGSYAGFSDIFRYKVLYEHGGWYTDMDVTCLKRPDFTTEYVFRDHWLLSMVGNIMYCPAKCSLMKQSYELAARVVDEMNDDWHKPVRILCRFIEELGLTEYIRKGICNLDDSVELEEKFILGNSPFPANWYFVHWCNAMSRHKYQPESTYYNLLKQYGCAP